MLNKQGCELQQDGPLGLSIDFMLSLSTILNSEGIFL